MRVDAPRVGNFSDQNWGISVIAVTCAGQLTARRPLGSVTEAQERRTAAQPQGLRILKVSETGRESDARHSTDTHPSAPNDARERTARFLPAPGVARCTSPSGPAITAAASC